MWRGGKRGLKDVHPIGGVVKDADDFDFVSVNVIEDVVGFVRKQPYRWPNLLSQTRGEWPFRYPVDRQQHGSQIALRGGLSVNLSPILVRLA
jgi:hypothetical protein